MIVNRSGIVNGLIVFCMKNMIYVKLILLVYIINVYGIIEMVIYIMY